MSETKVVVEGWNRTKELLRRWTLPFAETREAAGYAAAAAAAEEMGYPVALKGISSFHSHKSEHGLVSVGLDGADELANECRRMKDVCGAEGFLVQKMAGSGFEMITGIIRDPVFGPVVMIGPGGVFVELLEDAHIMMPPFTEMDVTGVLRRMKCFPLMNGYRGGPAADIKAFAEFAVLAGKAASSLEQDVESVDFNPVIVHQTGCTAVDVRISVFTGGADD